MKTIPAEVWDFINRTCLLATNAGGWFDDNGFKVISPLCDEAFIKYEIDENE